jgi:signal transduction histidine kinase/CheY-like chemotaxis protein
VLINYIERSYTSPYKYRRGVRGFKGARSAPFFLFLLRLVEECAREMQEVHGEVNKALEHYYEGVEKPQIIGRLLSTLFYVSEAQTVVFVEKSREIHGCFYFHLIVGPTGPKGATGTTNPTSHSDSKLLDVFPDVKLISNQEVGGFPRFKKRKATKKWSFPTLKTTQQLQQQQHLIHHHHQVYELRSEYQLENIRQQLELHEKQVDNMDNQKLYILESKRNLLVLERPHSVVVSAEEEDEDTEKMCKSVQVALNTIDNLFYHRQRKRGDYVKERAYHQIVKTMVTPLVIFDVRDVKKHLGESREEIDPTKMICTFANQSFCALSKIQLDYSEQAYFDKAKNPFCAFLAEPNIYQRLSSVMNSGYYHSSSDSGSLNESINNGNNNRPSDSHASLSSSLAQDGGGITLLKYEDDVIPKGDYECFIYRVNGTRAGVVMTDISEKIKQMDLVEQASRGKSEFLANINHEFRTPLNSIDGNLQLLMRTHPFTDRQRDLIHRMRLSSTALMNLLQEVLDYAKLEQHRMKLREEVFSLRHCIQSSVDILASAAQKKHNALNFSIALDVPTLISGDSFRLQQILVNLLNNSIHHTESGQINIQVEVKNATNPLSLQEPPKGVGALSVKGAAGPIGVLKGRPAPLSLSLSFTVSDTGTGIDEEMQGRLFVPWSHGDPLKLNSGTGLGLAICKELCVLMGGSIWLQSSQVGQGSVFVFEIPLKSAESVVTIAESAQKEIQMIRGKQILYFDQDDTQRRAVVKCLLNWGVRPTTCSDPEEMQGFLQAGFTFDLVFISGIRSCHNEHDNRGSKGAAPPLSLLQMAEWIKVKFPHIPLLGAALDEVAYDEACLEVFRKVIVSPIDTNHLFRLLVHLSSGVSSQSTVQQQQHHQQQQQPLMNSHHIHNGEVKEGDSFGHSGGRGQLHLVSSGVGNVGEDGGRSSSPIGGLRILVVEDVRENAIVLVEMIRVLGYDSVKWVENGQEMLEELQKKEIDVVLVDLLMPVMNGLDAVEKYRKETKKELGSFPIMVAVTATTLINDDPKSYHGAGMDAFVQKPIKMQELQTLLEIISEQKILSKK